MADEEFPDTHVDLDVDAKGNKLRTRLLSSSGGDVGASAEEFMVTSTPTAMPSLQKLKNKQKKAGKNEKAQGKKQEAPKPPPKAVESVDEPQKSSKRGHHGRKKKLKEKYKDQDEEERLLKMQLLRVSICNLICATDNFVSFFRFIPFMTTNQNFYRLVQLLE